VSNLEKFKVKDGVWIREIDEKGRLVREWFLPKKKVKKVRLLEYEDLAKEGEPLPEKYYKFKPKGSHRFVMQRHYPTGKLTPVKKVDKADWCTQAGGNWITDDGQHICVGIKDWDKVPNKVRGLMTEPRIVQDKPKNGYKHLASEDEVRDSIDKLPLRAKEGIFTIHMTDETEGSTAYITGNSINIRNREVSNKNISEKKALLEFTIPHEYGHNLYEHLDSSERSKYRGLIGDRYLPKGKVKEAFADDFAFTFSDTILYDVPKERREKVSTFILGLGKSQISETGKSDRLLELYTSTKMKCNWACQFFNQPIVKDNLEEILTSLLKKFRDHIDIRIEIDNHLVGFAPVPPVPKGQTAWDAFKERMEVGQRSEAIPKHPHPKEWLTREGKIEFPTIHEGARHIAEAQMEVLDKGEVKFGVQRNNLHEYFFYGKHLKGRWVLRLLTVGTPAHKAWIFMKPEDQKPLDPVEHEDAGYTKIEIIGEKKAIQKDWCEGKGGIWRTIRGNRVCILEGEGPGEAFRRQRFAKVPIPSQEKEWTKKNDKKLEELRAMNPRRKELWKKYNEEYDELPDWIQESVTRRVLYGSYTTNKSNPGDIDVILFIDPEKELSDDQVEYLFGELEEQFDKPNQEVNIQVYPDEQDMREEYLEKMRMGALPKDEGGRGYKNYVGLQH